MTLTDNQRTVLTAISGFTDAPTTRELSDKLETPEAYSRLWGYDRVHSILTRLEKRSLVYRDTRKPAHWSLTQPGREAIA